MALFPNTPANLLDGPVRVLWAATTVAKPTKINDIIDIQSPYAAKTGWNDFGATTDATEYGRDMDSEEYFIEQETSSVLEKITEVSRSLTLPIGEITPENMQIVEAAETNSITTVAAAANQSAQKTLSIGGVESLTRYRIAFVAMRDKGFGGEVTETTGLKRGPLIAFCAYQAALAAEGSDMSVQKGELVSRDISFRFFPDSTVTNTDENVGLFMFEQTGTISAV